LNHSISPFYSYSETPSRSHLPYFAGTDPSSIVPRPFPHPETCRLQLVICILLLSIYPPIGLKTVVYQIYNVRKEKTIKKIEKQFKFYVLGVKQGQAQKKQKS
jgi:hypothetical protein